MKRGIAAVAVVVLVIGATLYFTGVIGCVPKTKIAQRKLYDGPATLGSATEDWPRWRGPRGDGITREAIPDQWPAGGPKQLWAADVGLGYSSPVAAAGRIYLFSMSDRTDTLTAFDANSGKIVWSVEGGEGFTKSYVGTRATPAIDGDRIYTYGGQGDLTCRDLANGRERWKLNVLKETGSENIGWGMASTPLVTESVVHVQSGSGGSVAVAVDKISGKVVWKSQATGKGGYAHPILADVAGSKQLVIFAGTAIIGMDPRTGATLWQYPWQTSYDVNATTPIYHDGRLFLSSEYDHGCIQLQLSPTAAVKVWENQNVLSKFNAPVLDGGYLYANSAGTLVCVSWADGSLKWKATDSKLRLGIGGSLIRGGGDKLVTMSERGKLSLVRASPAGVQLIGQGEVVEGKEVWSTPLIYGGRVYAKGAQELVCMELK